MKKLLSVLLLFGFFGIANAQNLGNLIQNISDQLNTVQSEKKTFKQKIETIQPGVVRLQIEETDSKGRSKNYMYEFNLADLDPNTVRAMAKRDVFTVSLSTEKKQRLIKKVVDNNKVSYVYDLSIFASDPDNGRNLSDAIKKAIPEARKVLEKRLALKGYSDRMNWLKEHIGEVHLPDKQIDQNFKENNKYPGSVVLVKHITMRKNDKNKTFYFNLALFNPKKVDFYINGNLFGVKLNILRGDRFVKVVENGEQKTYSNQVVIVAKSVEEARDMKSVLTDIIPLAKQKFKSVMPNVSSLAKGNEMINALVEKVQINQYAYNQKMTGDCIVHFEQTVSDSKKTNNDVYEFNLSDINERQIKLKSKGKAVVVELVTNSNLKYIKQNRNGEVKTYRSSFQIYAPSVESALIIEDALKDMVAICKKKNETKNKKKISKGEATKELNDKNFKYQRIIAEGKSSKELIYEVNLSDLDPKSIKIVVSGKNVNVVINTKNNEKLIKSYKDGKVQPYKNRIDIPAPDIESARKIKYALQHLVK